MDWGEVALQLGNPEQGFDFVVLVCVCGCGLCLCLCLWFVFVVCVCGYGLCLCLWLGSLTCERSGTALCPSVLVTQCHKSHVFGAPALAARFSLLSPGQRKEQKCLSHSKRPWICVGHHQWQWLDLLFESGCLNAFWNCNFPVLLCVEVTPVCCPGQVAADSSSAWFIWQGTRSAPAAGQDAALWSARIYRHLQRCRTPWRCTRLSFLWQQHVYQGHKGYSPSFGLAAGQCHWGALSWGGRAGCHSCSHCSNCPTSTSFRIVSNCFVAACGHMMAQISQKSITVMAAWKGVDAPGQGSSLLTAVLIHKWPWSQWGTVLVFQTQA